MRKSGYIILTIKFNKEGKNWVAYCEELGTSTFGRSIEEAKKRIKEAIELHLNTLEDVGELDRFFGEHKIRFYESMPPQEEFKCSFSYDPNSYFNFWALSIPKTVSA